MNEVSPCSNLSTKVQPLSAFLTGNYHEDVRKTKRKTEAN